MNSPQEQTVVSALNWGRSLEAWLCENCDWSFLVLPQETHQLRCPHCFTGLLVQYKGQIEELTYANPPELVAPHSLPSFRLDESIRQFASGIPFAPLDLTAEQIRKRLQPIYLPVWLVDSRVSASWKAEVGFDYEVVSHQEFYEQAGSRWTSQELKETRTRWEMRLGQLDRSYQNIPTPALEDHWRIKKRVGTFDFSQAKTYEPKVLNDAFIRLPDRAPDDAWSEALPAFQTAAAGECMQAAGADHIRQFVWQPEFLEQSWSLLLLPAYTSYYLDDQQKPQPVVINGQNGALSGKRIASQQRAQKTSMILFALAVVACLISLGLAAAGLVFPPAFVLAVISMILAFLLGLGAVVPVGMVWLFNRAQASTSPSDPRY